MKTIPNDIKANGTKIMVVVGKLTMPMDKVIIKKHCGHLPRTEAEAKIMAMKLGRVFKSKPIDFPNMQFTAKNKSDKRQSRIERRKRKGRGVMKINFTVKLESDIKKSELFEKLLEIDGVKKIKKIGETSIELETDRKLTQMKVNDQIIKILETDFADFIKELQSIDFQD